MCFLKRRLNFILLLLALSLSGVLFGCGEKNTKIENTLLPPLPQATYADNLITVTEIAGCEYRLDYGVWQDSNIFSADSWKQYTIIIRYKETDKKFASDISALNIFTAEFDGLGTENNPYIINTAQDFQKIIFAAGAVYKLGNNIDFQNEVWTPVGTMSTPFCGRFYGNNKTVENIVLKDGGYLGLFGYVNDLAFICDLYIKNFFITAASECYAGALIGYGANITVENILAENINIKILGKNIRAGGIAGELNGITKVDNCDSKTKINIGTGTTTAGENYLGGITGYFNGALNLFATCISTNAETVINTSEANISTEYIRYFVGGMFGYASFASISLGRSTLHTGVAEFQDICFGGVAGAVRFLEINNLSARFFTQRAVNTVYFRAGGITGRVDSPGLLHAEKVNVQIYIIIKNIDNAGLPMESNLDMCVGGIAGSGALELYNINIDGKIDALRQEDSNGSMLLMGGVVGYSEKISISRANIRLDIIGRIRGHIAYAGGITGSGAEIFADSVVISGDITLYGSGIPSLMCGGVSGSLSRDNADLSFIIISGNISTKTFEDEELLYNCYSGGLFGRLIKGTDDAVQYRGVYYEGTLNNALSDYNIQKNAGQPIISCGQRLFAKTTLELFSAESDIFADFPACFFLREGEYPVIINQ